MAFALGVALDSDYPLAEDQIPRIEVPEDLLTKFPVTVCPEGTVEGVVGEFRWNWQGRTRSWQVVVLDQSTEELFRSDFVTGTRWKPGQKQLEQIVRDRRLYWYVSSGDGPRRLQSDLQSFTLQ